MSGLSRSTRAGRGELAGPAPTARQVRRVTLVVSSPEPGVLVLQQPDTGLIASARTQPELARAISEAFTAVQCAAYSMWRQAPTVRRTVLKPSASPRRRRDVYSPADWAPDPDQPGVWRSPSGRSYREDSEAVQGVKRKRGMLG